jgi:hypothetical protein
MNERTNTDRAQRALETLASQEYDEGLGLTNDPDMAHQAVKDLLGDLRHFCDRAGVDYAAADRSGYRTYREERAEDPAGSGVLSTPEAGPGPVVVIVRHPDHANTVEAFPGDGMPVVLDVDLGSGFDGTAESVEKFHEWLAGMEQTYRDSGLPVSHPAFAAFMEAVESADPTLPA